LLSGVVGTCPRVCPRTCIREEEEDERMSFFSSAKGSDVEGKR
jgi:hypothetical protein